MLSQVVNQASTTTALASNLNPSGYGQERDVYSDRLIATATGSVQFFVGTTSLGTKTLSGGVASLSTSSLTGGSHSITATYRWTPATAVVPCVIGHAGGEPGQHHYRARLQP